MVEAVNLLCALGGLACALLLFKGYRRSRARLLIWSSVCFLGLALNNTLPFLDGFFPQIGLLPWRHATALGALMLLLYGMVFDSE